MFSYQKSFAGDKYEKLGGYVAKGSFLEGGERRIDIANKKIEKSVKEFGENLGPLTDLLVRKFEKYRANPKYSGLTDSDIWLNAIEKIYSNNSEKMPGQLEGYLRKMMVLLVEYKKAHNTVDGIATILKSSTAVNEVSKISSNLSWENLPPFNSKIRPAEGIEPLSATS